MLQAINRYEPLLAHYAESGDAPSRERCSSSAWRRPASWRRSPTTSKRPPKFPGYRHDRLRESFEPVIAALRESLSKVLDAERDLRSRSSRRSSASASRSSPTIAVQHRGLHPGGARRSAGGGAAAPVSRAAQDRAGREDRRSGAAAAAGRAGARRCRWRRGRFRFTPDSPTSSSIRPTSCGSSSRTRAAWRCTSPGEFPGLAMEFWAIRS